MQCSLSYYLAIQLSIKTRSSASVKKMCDFNISVRQLLARQASIPHINNYIIMLQWSAIASYLKI